MMPNDPNPAADSPPTVYVIDDDEDFRALLARQVPTVGLSVKTYASAVEFLEGFQHNGPGCIVADIRMPEMNGLQLQERLVQDNVQLPLILITAHAEVSMAVRALKSGAADFVEKPYSPHDLLERIQRAVQGDLARRDSLVRYEQIGGYLNSLTEREKEVMQLLVDGQTSKEISGALKISLPTVDFHRRNILGKFEVENVVQLARMIDFYLHFQVSDNS